MILPRLITLLSVFFSLVSKTLAKESTPIKGVSIWYGVSQLFDELREFNLSPKREENRESRKIRGFYAKMRNGFL